MLKKIKLRYIINYLLVSEGKKKQDLVEKKQHIDKERRYTWQALILEWTWVLPVF